MPPRALGMPSIRGGKCLGMGKIVPGWANPSGGGVPGTGASSASPSGSEEPYVDGIEDEYVEFELDSASASALIALIGAASASVIADGVSVL